MFADWCLHCHYSVCMWTFVCTCESMASKCATMTHESSHPGPWGVRAETGGPETTVRPATVALSCQRCQNESAWVVEGKLKKNGDTFLFRTTPGQR